MLCMDVENLFFKQKLILITFERFVGFISNLNFMTENEFRSNLNFSRYVYIACKRALPSPVLLFLMSWTITRQLILLILLSIFFT